MTADKDTEKVIAWQRYVNIETAPDLLGQGKPGLG